MIKILITVIALLLIILVIRRHSKFFVITPQFAFVVSFIPSLVMLSLFIEKWQIDLDNITIILIITGAIVFTAVSFWTERIINRYRIVYPWTRRNITNREVNIKISNNLLVDNATLLVFILTGMVGVIAYYIYILSFTGSFSLSNFSIILMNYRNAYNEESLDMPALVSITSMISTCIADYFVYYYFKNRTQLRRTGIKKLLIFFCCLPGVLIPLLSGARGGVINFGMFVFAAAVINSAKEVRLQKKTIRLAVIVAVIAIATFRIGAVFMGRDVNIDAIDYIGMYLPAPIRNLDYIIKTENIGLFTGFGDSANRTFSKFLNFLAFRFGLKITPATGRRTLMINGYYTGNMYTVYYNLLHDVGFIGSMLMIALTALLCQVFFSSVRNKIRNNENKSTSVIVYALVYSYLFLSFFNENFFYNVFTNYFLRQVIFFMLIDWFVRNTTVTYKRT